VNNKARVKYEKTVLLNQIVPARRKRKRKRKKRRKKRRI